MPSIEISDGQAESLTRLREALAEEYVGEYGTVRAQDALQYLLDRYEGKDVAVVAGLLEERLHEYSYQELQRLAGLTEGVDATGKEADLRERLASARAAHLLAPDTWGGADVRAVEPDDGETASDSAAVDGGHDGEVGSRLERMMGLLEEYSERWEEAETEEGKYVVTLPDGGTESARTKEDVRAVLFRHYA